MKPVPLTGIERRFKDDEIIVSKTDLKGRITYGNDVFIRISGYREAELLGQPHSIVRHPHMPRNPKESAAPGNPDADGAGQRGG